MPDGTPQWDPVTELAKKYPGIASEPREKMVDYLSDPKNFRASFPEYKGLDDTTIRSNMLQYRGQQQQPPADPLASLQSKGLDLPTNMGVSAPQPQGQQLMSALGQGPSRFGAALAQTTGASKVQQLLVPGTGVTVGQAGERAEDWAGKATSLASMLAGPEAEMGALPNIRIASTARAGANLNEVRAALIDHPVDLSKGAGDAAMRAWELSRRGGGSVKAIEDFVRRVATDPDPITFGEARDFYQNLKPSVMERLTNKGSLKAAVAEFKTQLGNALNESAATGGRLQQYQQAMKEYHDAAKMKGAIASAAGAGATAALGAAKFGVGAEILKYVLGK